jgi:uncharacterized protein YjbI with pentapeptide repeats
MVAVTIPAAIAAGQATPTYMAKDCDSYGAGVDHSNCDERWRMPSGTVRDNGPDGYGWADTSFPDSNFTGANLSGVNLAGTDFERTDFTNANLSNTNFGFTYKQWFMDMDSYGDMYVKRSPVCLWQHNWAQACLALGARLTGVNLEGADLTGAKLDHVTSGSITGTPKTLPTGYKLINGYLVGPNAYLVGANLQGADLSGSDVNLCGVVSGEITGNPILPAGWMLYKGYLVGPTASLFNADLSGANLDGFDFSAQTTNRCQDSVGGTFYQMRSGGIKGNPILPSGWKLIKGYLLGPEANLKNANLKGFDLSGLDLSHANTEGLRSGGITKGPKVLPNNLDGHHYDTDTQLVKGYIIAPGVDLSNENLGAMNLKNANLVGANLNKTNLTKVSLELVKTGSVTGSPILPPGFKLVKGYIVGPKVNLFRANLVGANLTGLSLSGAYMTNADLSKATIDPKNNGVVLWGPIPRGKPSYDMKLPNKWSLARGNKLVYKK